MSDEQLQQPKKRGAGAANAGTICLILGCLLMYASLWAVILYAPLFLAAFILGIVAISQGRPGPGTLVLLCSLIVPFILFVGLGATRMKDVAEKVAATNVTKAAQLQIFEIACAGEGGSNWVSGTVKNNGVEAVAFPKLSAIFLAQDGSLIDTATGYADKTPLLGGQMSTFKIFGPHNQSVASCKVTPAS